MLDRYQRIGKLYRINLKTQEHPRKDSQKTPKIKPGDVQKAPFKPMFWLFEDELKLIDVKYTFFRYQRIGELNKINLNTQGNH